MIPKTIIHLLSGGLDSVTMLYDLKSNGHLVHCLLADYRQRNVQELTFAKGHCRSLGVLWTTMELPELGGLTAASWIVPNRNAILLSLAVSLACRSNSEAVTIGCNADDSESFPDCRKEFMESMNASVRAAGCNVELCAPYLDKTKRDIARTAKELEVPLNNVWSCYIGGAKPCGACPACLKLEAALL